MQAVGALVGGVLSALFDVITQAFVQFLKGKKLTRSNFDKKSFVLNAVTGALGGVLGCSTYKRLVQAIGGGVLNMFTNVVLNIISGRSYKYILKTAFVDFILGAIIGIISGNGLGTKYFRKGLFHKGHFVYKGRPYYSSLRLQATKGVLKDFASGLWKTISLDIYNSLTSTARAFGW